MEDLPQSSQLGDRDVHPNSSLDCLTCAWAGKTREAPKVKMWCHGEAWDSLLPPQHRLGLGTFRCSEMNPCTSCDTEQTGTV